ncbi:MAG TPA: tRNA lysidine(34) synthetase TilS [Caulobacteraceae bacterium]|nr:tRNA lysidine(34) synthetase TilS [Caulobacteraceae bacterium]
MLNAPDRAPVTVAVSGGGDSMALLCIAAAWADRAGRPLVALTVDHALQPASAGWCAFVAERAAALGLRSRTLVWRGEKPRSGLPAAARAARHALLADATRELGARAVLMAHTADDVLEAQAMRTAGCIVPTPRTWSPSPAWPEGRGVFILRPLLGVRRAALRDLLRERGERWVEDPANEDPRYARSAARRRLAGQPTEDVSRLSDHRGTSCAVVVEGAAGELTAARAAFGASNGRSLLSAMLLCASGGARPPRGSSLDRLLLRLAAGEDFVATLAGARLEAAGEDVTCCREAGERRRGGLAEVTLPVGETVFDGRFLVAATEPGWRVVALRGVASRLPKAERAWLAGAPAAPRAALPAAISPAGDYFCPIVRQSGPVVARSLSLNRLQAALGCIADEASLWRVAQTPLGA